MTPEKENLKKYYDLKIKDIISNNSILHTINREHKQQTCQAFPHRMQSLPAFIKQLGFHKNLEGHRGCVNCIEFSEDGRYLISGSDDTKLILWDMAQLRSKNICNTRHRGNIFTAKFLPKTANSCIVSGAADNQIQVKNIFSGDYVSLCNCHSERIKRIATLPSSPDVYFSASEDGTIRQFDRRESHKCGPQANNIIVDLRRLSDTKLEAKCVTVNPIHTDIIAIGATDAYIRVYDRRKLTLTSTDSLSKTTDINELTPECLQYFTPGHLPEKMVLRHNRLFKTLAITYLTYSSNGKDLLANIGGDNIYIFDTLNGTLPKKYGIPSRQNGENTAFGSSRHISKRKFPLDLPYNMSSFEKPGSHYLSCLLDDFPKDEWLPQDVKDLIAEAKYQPNYLKVELYNEAIELWPHSCQLYALRADVCLDREWDGDVYAALRDSEKALQLDSSCRKAMFTKIKSLHFSRKDQEALYEMEADSDIMARLRAKETNITALYDFLCKSNLMRIERKLKLPLPPKEHMSSDEKKFRSMAKDYEKAYLGHCNTTTDIKEVTFIGSDCEYIAAGSDDGNVFIWDRKTSNPVHVFKADQSIVNSVQFHPSICMMATSGIENLIKLWTPDKLTCLSVDHLGSVIRDNQMRMQQDPEMMMQPVDEMAYSRHFIPFEDPRIIFGSPPSDDDSDNDRPFRSRPPTENSCRTS